MKTVKGDTGPRLNYPGVESALFENLGATVEVVVNGTLDWQGQSYTLKQFHFHTPCEHRIGEESFPIEMHLVHTTPGKCWPQRSTFTSTTSC